MPHEVYMTNSGEILPSVTEIIDTLGSKILMRWSNNLGFRRIKYDEFMNQTATRGTICHEIIAHLIDPNSPIHEYSVSSDFYKEICQYETEIRKFYKACKFDPQFMERPFLSEELGYAGCPDYYGSLRFHKDLVAKNNLALTKYNDALVDWKTSKKPSEKHFLQLGGYSTLLKSQGIIPKWYIIVDFHSNTQPSIVVKSDTSMLKYEEAFKYLLEFYKVYSTMDPSILKTKR